MKFTVEELEWAVRRLPDPSKPGPDWCRIAVCEPLEFTVSFENTPPEMTTAMRTITFLRERARGWNRRAVWTLDLSQ